MSTSTASAASARVGSTVAGKYRLDRVIGMGGIGSVYAAVHAFTGKHVAVKILDASIVSSEGYAARFLREARAAAEIDHPAICDVIDAGQEPDGTLYLVLELLEGRTLDDAIESSDVQLEEMVNIAIQLLDGLAAAHDRGIVHRDIKPENVFLTYDQAGELRVKLLDFGVAKSTKGAPDVVITAQGAILGTPYYMSPEQAAGDLVDSRADLWSAGAVLFHALTGRPPYDEETYNKLIARLLNHDPPRVREVRPDLPEWLATVIDGALTRDPEARWQSARTMIETLRRRGRAPIDLDWEMHEDATVKTQAIYEPSEAAPAIAAKGAMGPTIEIDVELTGGYGAVPADGRTIKTVPPPMMRPRRRRWPIWLALLVVALAASAGWWFYIGSPSDLGEVRENSVLRFAELLERLHL